MKTLTNVEAFAPVAGEVSIPLDFTQHDFQFTRKWFKHRNQATWSTFLKPHFPGDKPIRMIQIGVFEAADLCWCLQNILTHPESRVIAIDPWLATTKLDQVYMDGVEARARHNLSPWKDKVHIRKGFSSDRLSEMLAEGGNESTFDLCVIDGDHTADVVVEDAILCLRLAKSKGLLVFDDVRNRVPKKDHVLEGIARFLDAHSDDVKLEWQHRYVDCYSKK